MDSKSSGGCLAFKMKAMALQRFRQFLSNRYVNWLDKRIPPHREITLVQNNIFIYPIRQFIYYLIVVMAIWLAATNYENNLSFALAFLMLGIFLVGIVHSYNNLAGLTVTAVGVEPVFCGEYADVKLLLTTQDGKWRDGLCLSWEREHQIQTSLFETTQVRVKVPVHALHRGWFNPKRMRVESVYPLGIIRSISYVDLDINILVYPKPVCHSALLMETQDAGDGEGQSTKKGTDEFDYLKPFETGSSLRQVAWKHYAKTGELFLKEYGEYASQHLWLDWNALLTLEKEERLSALCYWALEFDKKNAIYGLNLPEIKISPNTGLTHLQQVLTALALFDIPSFDIPKK